MIHPVQKRSAQTRARILETAEDLLGETPPGDITTSLLSERAQIAVGSIYRYFPNVHAVLRALFEDMNAPTRVTLAGAMANNDDWRNSLAELGKILLVTHTARPAYGALMAHLGSDQTDADLIETLAAHWAAGGNGFDGEADHARRIARTTMDIVTAAELRFHRTGADREAQFGETLRAIEAYLDVYLD